MKLRTIITTPIVFVAAGLLLSACGQASQVPGTATISAAAAVVSQSSTSTAPAATSKAVAQTPAGVAEAGALGQVIVGANGNTLYAFTKDVDGISTCFDACAAAWPAVIVTDGFAPPTGVDPALVSSVDRPDGTKQLKIGKWPLYFYAGDGAPSETNGQGVGGVWFAQAIDGTLVKGDTAPVADPTLTGPAPASAAEAPVAEAPEASAPVAADLAAPVVSLAQVGDLGEVMVGADGHTLYAFTNDPAGESTCFDACAEAWPPLTVENGFVISDELQASGVSTIDRPDGSKQLVMGKWALYSYAGDGAPGEANGQGVGGKWFTIDANCTLVKTAS